MITKGIGLGIGFFIGLAVMFLIIGSIIWIVLAIYRSHLKRKFSIELFRNYHQELIKSQQYEEIEQVNEIINKLKNNEPLGKLIENYSIDIDSYLYWQPLSNGGERLTYKHNKRIIRKNKNKDN